MLFVALTTASIAYSNRRCPCIKDSPQLAALLVNDSLSPCSGMIRPSGAAGYDDASCLPPRYGLGTCEAWDADTNPCNTSSPAAYCEQPCV